jgi:putative membrane protein
MYESSRFGVVVLEVFKMHHSQASRVAAVLFLTALTAPAGAAGKPTDPQIAHIAYTAGDLDIKAAKLALEISKNDDVRAFANDMIRDHKAVNDNALELVKQLNVTPEDNDTSKGLVKQADDKRAELAKLSGAAFDKAYADNEVAYHKTVNGALATVLIPSSSNASLKSLLETGLKIFKGHENHAEVMAAKLK